MISERAKAIFTFYYNVFLSWVLPRLSKLIIAQPILVNLFNHFAKNSKSDISLVFPIIFKDRPLLNVLVGLSKLNYYEMEKGHVFT